MANNFLSSKNPIMKSNVLDSKLENSHILDHSDIMTMDGAVNKSLMLLGILLCTTYISYQMPSSLLLWSGIIGGLIAVLVASFKPHTSPISAPVYAAFEGLFVGSISAIYAAQFEGIVIQAVCLTFGTLLMMLLIYKTGLIQVTEKFKMGVMMATGAIMFVYMISILGHFVGFNVPYLHEGGVIGIGVSVVILGIAALNLLIDFDAFEQGVAARAPKYMEWYVSLGLLVTLVWLYIEFLRLLSKLSRD